MENVITHGKQSNNSILVFENSSKFYNKNANYYGPKIKNNKNISLYSPFIYPIFKDAAQYSESAYWKNAFFMLASNILSEDITYEISTLIYKKKKKLIIDENNLLMVYRDVKKFLGETLNLFDPKEFDEEPEREVLKKNFRWIDIKKESAIKIVNFVNTFNLTPEYREQMIRDISQGIQAKYFHNDNITVENDEIVSIQGLCVEKGYYVIDYNQTKPKKFKSRSRGSTTMSTTMSTVVSTRGPETEDNLLDPVTKSNYCIKWHKFLENCAKKNKV